MIDTEPTGKIIMEHVSLPFESERYVYRWEGGDVAEVNHIYLRRAGIQYNHVKIGDVLHIGQFRLRVVDHYPPWRGLIVVRDDWRGGMHYLVYRALYRFDGIYRRLILTLYVWELADYHEAAVPSLNDIHLVKRFKKWRDSRKQPVQD